MTAQTERLRATVDRLLTAYGEPMSFLRTSEGTYDPTTASADTPTTATYSGYGYPYPYSQYERVNSLVETGDDRIYAQKMSARPTVGDQVTFRTKAYRIVRVDEISMSGQELMFQLQVRI